MIAGLLDRGSIRDGLKDAGIIVRIVALDGEPAKEVRLAGPVEAASAGKIGVEIQHFVSAETHGIGRADELINQVVKVAVEKVDGETDALVAEKLIETSVERTALLGAQRGIARVAGILAEGLEDGRLLNSLAIGNREAGIRPEATGGAKSVDRAEAGNHARAKTRIAFGARARAESEASDGKPASIEEASLIVAARMETAQVAGVGVLDFILIAPCDRAAREGIIRLPEESRAIELSRFEKTKLRKTGGIEEPRFHAGDAMGPMGPRFEVPA